MTVSNVRIYGKDRKLIYFRGGLCEEHIEALRPKYEGMGFPFEVSVDKPEKRCFVCLVEKGPK